MSPGTSGNDGLGKIVWPATMSLDGFIAGPDDAMGWVFDTTISSISPSACPGGTRTAGDLRSEQVTILRFRILR